VPPRVEYELTPLGRTLIGPAITLAEWAIEHNPDVERNHDAYDARVPRRSGPRGSQDRQPELGQLPAKKSR
jgi:hypothetical protein